MRRQVEFMMTLEYKIAKLKSAEDWTNLKNLCPHLTPWGIKVLQSGLQTMARWVIIEPEYICKDHSNLYSNFYSKRFANVARHTFRIHFFSQEFDSVDAWQRAKLESLQDQYLGYAVIRDSSERCLGRCVFDPQKLQPGKDVYILRAEFSVTLLGRRLTVSGFPFMSQDQDITVCAHSTLWAVCRYLSQKFKTYGEYLPFDIVQSVHQMSGRVYPYRSMTYNDYSQILTEFGVYPLVEKGKIEQDKSNLDFLKNEEELYVYLESGFPVIASYGNHVAAIVGHTLKQEKPALTMRFTSTHEMVESYLIVDDNLFPYAKLGDNGYKYSKTSIKTIVVPLPEKVFLTANKIITYVDRMQSSKKFEARMRDIAGGPFLRRIFIATSISYKRELQKFYVKTGSEAAGTVLAMKLPHYVWVVEIMNQASYGALEADAVFLLDPTAEPTKSLDKVILFRNLAGSYSLPDSTGKPRVAHDPVQKMPMFIHNLS